ncbi:MAG: DUF1156 domain-containing protein, partial [Planctomycetota bacterium]
MNYPKRLIEVDLPIARISAHARREKSIRHGHISTLHIWWARRPLAACRAVICAALWPDPADPLCPQAFRDKAAELVTAFAKKATTTKKLAETCSQESFARWEAIAKTDIPLDPTDEAHQNVLRFALLDFIADFANWDNSTVPDYLETSRALTQAAHEALGGEPGTRPLVVDPFAGGGSIPLEALRVGADAFASDLNPVAVLLNKVVLEYIPKYGSRLADEVRRLGAGIQQEAEAELARFYPLDPDGHVPLAYVWARTIRCEGPGCGIEIPLSRSLWLAKKGKRSVALRLVPSADERALDIELVANARHGGTFEGPVKRGSATCPICGFTTSADRVREQFKDRHGGADDSRLLAVLIQNARTGEREYRLPIEQDMTAVKAATREFEQLAERHDSNLSLVPDEPFPYLRSIFNIKLLDVNDWGSLFTSRQCLVLATLGQHVASVGSRLGNEVEGDFAVALQTCLAFIFNKVADRCNALARWEPNVQCPQQLFGRQAIPIVWDFGEACVLRDCAGSWPSLLNVWCQGVANIANAHIGGRRSNAVVAMQADAAAHPLPEDAAEILFTDPPYYDMVPYADLSDFFYVWLKRNLRDVHPGLLSDQLTPKRDEIVQLAERNPIYSYKTKEHFETRMRNALAKGRCITKPDALGIFVFAHKETTAWETMLEAVVGAGWTATASWPIDTEMATRLRAMNSAALASSVHVVCRPRENPDGSLREEIGEWRDVLAELPKRIHEWMPRLAQEGIVGADAIFACLGPGLEIFSRYSRVEKASGEEATLREYLEQVWGAVSTEALRMIFDEADAAGLEPDAGLTGMWLWTLGAGTGKTDGNGEGPHPRSLSEKESSRI